MLSKERGSGERPTAIEPLGATEADTAPAYTTAGGIIPAVTGGGAGAIEPTASERAYASDDLAGLDQVAGGNSMSDAIYLATPLRKGGTGVVGIGAKLGPVKVIIGSDGQITGEGTNAHLTYDMVNKRFIAKAVGEKKPKNPLVKAVTGAVDTDANFEQEIEFPTGTTIEVNQGPDGFKVGIEQVFPPWSKAGVLVKLSYTFDLSGTHVNTFAGPEAPGLTIDQLHGYGERRGRPPASAAEAPVEKPANEVSPRGVPCTQTDWLGRKPPGC